VRPPGLLWAALGGVAVLLGSGCPALAAPAAAASSPAPGAMAPPTALCVAGDPKDRRGNELVVSWAAPATPAPAGLVLGGYVVYLADGGSVLWDYLVSLFGGRHGTEGREAEGGPPPKRQELLVAPEELETRVTDLKPWRHYRLGVAAVYVPAGSKLEPDALVPTAPGTDGAVESDPVESDPVSPRGKWYKTETTNILVFSLFYIAVVLLTIVVARRRDMYIRPIAGLRAVDDAIGRATEMGRPILYVAGLSGIGDIATIAAMLILGHLSKRTAAYETPVLVPCQDPLVMSVEREIVREAYLEVGKPDAFNPDNIFFVTDSQFGYVAAVDGIMLRQRPAANFYMGAFFAESLILAETGNATGAIQIAGTDSDTQLPFFITACDYTLMGEELYAASAYLSRDPLLLAQLKGQDIGKVLLVLILLVGFILVAFAGAGEWFLKLLEVKGG
jgi:hypothetical protein